MEMKINGNHFFSRGSERFSFLFARERFFFASASSFDSMNKLIV